MLEIARKTRTLYEILEVPETASTSEIKRAYKRLASIHHPDKVANTDDPELKQRAEDELIKINNAKDILLDANKRSEYDLLLRVFKTNPAPTYAPGERHIEDSFDIELELSVPNHPLFRSTHFIELIRPDSDPVCANVETSLQVKPPS